MRIEFTADLVTGIDVVDKQHRELFSRVNALLDACMEGLGAEKVQETLDFLGWYVIEHFDTEEEVMRRARYQGYAQHAALHRDFRRSIAELHDQIAREGVGTQTVVKVNRLVVNWLTAHIRKIDRVMAVALREEFARAAPATR